MPMENIQLKEYKNGSVEEGSDEERLTLLEEESRSLIVQDAVDTEIANLISDLFRDNKRDHITTDPDLPPEVRFKRHRNYYIWLLNQFRHWWKTSRLSVRFSGATVFIQDEFNWTNMAVLDVTKHRQLKAAAKLAKQIGQGAPIRLFLAEVQPFTRTIRIILAVARALEARVDNRLVEVGLAEAFAFMGNRCARYWSRQFASWATKNVALPFAGATFAPYIDPQCRPVIITMGLIRAFLPFAMSFQGSRFGRQVTYNTYKYAAYRWKSIQSIRRFHEKAGTYQDTNLDPALLAVARKVAETLGHAKDPVKVRERMAEIGFKIFGAGNGGHSVYRLIEKEKVTILHVTPYGPSILDELPMFIALERRHLDFGDRFAGKTAGTRILDAASKPEAFIVGFTYSGAYFQSQEWAALKRRHDKELLDYTNACHTMRTRAKKVHGAKFPVPPKDLASLKAFIRSGRPPYKKTRDDTRWRQVMREVEKMAQQVQSLQKDGKAPKRVILYLEGLDCAGKSSTGMLICDALSKCGFDVTVAQHNRPPTDTQKIYRWMDRIRFEYPDDMYEDKSPPECAAVVWDRGPAGDFVYGKMSDLSLEEKVIKYQEFRSYDVECRDEGVLFCKILFVTDKDSIAATLGKRLAHKRIVRDLHAWLDANSSQHFREGLQEIEMHIDPTDFVAFNRYEENLKKFSDFARNTDDLSDMASLHGDFPKYSNPWLVVNTSNRHMARLNIMKAFEGQLARFARDPYAPQNATWQDMSNFLRRDFFEEIEEPSLRSRFVKEQKEFPVSGRVILQVLILLALLYAYIYQTWNVRWEDMI